MLSNLVSTTCQLKKKELFYYKKMFNVKIYKYF